MKADSTAYPAEKYEAWLPMAISSARAILPPVIQMIRPASVLDVGCGLGIWLSVCRELGIEHIHGIDGAYVPRDLLKIPESCYSAVELHDSWPDLGPFDLAISLETAEHLDPEAAERYVDNLVSVAPVILFSAAIPFQGGNDHRNEQWPEYWVAKFRQRGFTCIDCLRHTIANDLSIDWWYRQNVFLAASSQYLSGNSLLRSLAERYGPPERQVTWECYENRCRTFEYLAKLESHSFKCLVLEICRRMVRAVTRQRPSS